MDGIFCIFVLMKDLFHKITSFLIAILLLGSTISWTVEKHYCMGRVMDIAIFHEAKDCGMQMMNSEEDMKMDCCSDEITVVQGQDDLKISFDELTFDQQLFLAAYTHSYINLYNVLREHVVPHKEYPPPILVKDIQVLDQVFLI